MATDPILPSEIPASVVYSSSSSATSAAEEDGFEDGCSICLEPFSSNDPPTVTKCKHEYHLQCILEWSQRSQECPICSRKVVLEEPASQDLLVVVESENNARSRYSLHYAPAIHESDSMDYADGSDFEERIMRRFAALTSRARSINRMIRMTSSGVVLPSAPTEAGSDLHHITDYPEESQGRVHEFLGSGLPPSRTTSSSIGQTTSLSTFPFLSNVAPAPAAGGDDSTNQCEFPESPQRSSSSELLAFSESIKYKLSAASSRYKETFSKSTRGFKEKLLARNTTVKELGKEVQREMSAGIAGVARMIERLDLSSKRSPTASDPLSSNTEEGNAASQYHDDGNNQESTSKMVSNVTPLLCSNNSRLN
ncbi:unnamed protein product [Cuscuta epithymum]|uniref:RING-type E3 ubiquitin transferase n=1 Tax=Cuscuta epithymum TaxID=186058 RepID=A0AAV0CXM5_9ASTE|nr:unnamed protein product [Cuscuta epithymum]